MWVIVVLLIMTLGTIWLYAENQGKGLRTDVLRMIAATLSSLLLIILLAIPVASSVNNGAYVDFVDLRGAVQSAITSPSIPAKEAHKLESATWRHNRSVLDHRRFCLDETLGIFYTKRLASLPLVNLRFQQLDTGDYKVLYMGDDLTIPQYKK